MDLETLVETLDKELKNEDQRFPLNQSRKSDFLFSISSALKSADKSKIVPHQPKLEAIFFANFVSRLLRTSMQIVKKMLEIAFREREH
ncbi:unnamed protein product [Blepharisma stoltei]|uniref:Uncharacterized protein n=1 Tax=Blepharisma stoltei TaxID=1481888 RepID=A0AAU9J3I4_9CILI|nr:unnamed protein product [Blepharisma stoltei]